MSKTIRNESFGLLQILLTLFFLAAHLIVFSSVDVSAQSTPAAGGVYKLRNQCSGKMLDVSGVSTTNGADVHQWTETSGQNQMWLLQPTDSGFYQLTAQHSGKALEVASGSTNDGAVVQQWTFRGTAHQQWQIVSAGDDYYTLKPRHATSRALDVSGSSQANGAKVQIYSSNNSCAQKWKFELAAAPPPANTPYDLTVTDIVTEPATVQNGNQVSFRAVVKNLGGQTTPAGTIIGVAFSVNNQVVSWSDTFTSGLAGGASVTLAANNGPNGNSKWAAGTGTFTITAQVDDINRLPNEGNETNNIREEIITVAAGTGGDDVTRFGRFGMNNGTGYNTDPNYVNQAVARMQELGIKRVRMGMDGVNGNAEGVPFTFAGRDYTVDAYLRAGIKMHATISFRFFVSGDDLETRKRNWVYFVRGVFNRYKGKVTYYIVDNEPDLSYGSGWKAAQPANITVEFNRIAYQIAKEVDPNIRIESSPAASPCTPYNRDMLRSGIGNYADVIGTHIYGGQISNNEDCIARLKGYMNESGVNKPIAISEAGSIVSWAPSQGEAGRAQWYRNLGEYAKRHGVENVLAFDWDGHGEWRMEGTSSITAWSDVARNVRY